MTFSNQVKNELCQPHKLLHHCKMAQAYGILAFCRRFDSDCIELLTENDAVAECFVKIIFELVKVNVSVELISKQNNRQRNLYRVSVQTEWQRKQVLEFFGVKNDTVSLSSFLSQECCTAALIRGAFLSCGSISDPHKEYHLEFCVHCEETAIQLQQLLNEQGVDAKLVIRLEYFVVYVKESGQIEDVLTLMGAVKCSMELMNIKIYKDLRNKINRVTNCETANMDRTISAAAKQIEAIELVIKKLGMDALSEDLQLVARLRLDNPEMSLADLAQQTSGLLDKSAVNRRISKLLRMAANLS